MTLHEALAHTEGAAELFDELVKYSMEAEGRALAEEIKAIRLPLLGDTTMELTEGTKERIDAILERRYGKIHE